MELTRRTLLGAGAAGVAAASLAACGGEGSGEGGNDGAQPIRADGTEPSNPLIPTATNDVGGGRIVGLVFAGLMSYTPEGEVQNEVAESIDTEDNVTFTVTLKEGWTFSDGTPVTAKSFVDAWNYGANVNNGQSTSYFFSPIEGAAALAEEGVAPDATLTGLTVDSDTQFTVKLTAPQSDFVISLGYTPFSPLPESFFDDPEAFGQKPVGNGPYTLTSWEPNVGASLAPNPEYNGPRKAKNDGVELAFYQSDDTAYNDLLTGNVDVVGTIPESAYATFEDELGERAINQPAGVINGMSIHMEQPDFTGEAGTLRRRAISRAINREEVCAQIFQDSRSPAVDFTSPVLAGFRDDLEGNEVLQFDAEEAKRLWDEAEAISPFTGPFTISYTVESGSKTWVDAVCNQIRNALGIEASGRSYPDFKSMREDQVSRSIECAVATNWYGDYPSAFNFLGPLYGSAAADGNGSNHGDYKNEEFDAKLAEGLAATDQDEAFAKAAEAQEILLRDLPTIPLWNPNSNGGYSENVENVTFDWAGLPMFHAVTRVEG